MTAASDAAADSNDTTNVHVGGIQFEPLATHPPRHGTDGLVR